MISAGIDLGVHVIHIAIINDGEVMNASHLSIGKEHEPADVADLYDRLLMYLKIHWVERIVVEKPLIFPGQGFPVLKMVEMLTLVKLAANRINVPLIIVTPAQWRKRVLGNGKAEKSVAVTFCKKMGWEPDDHNIAESVCIGLFNA